MDACDSGATGAAASAADRAGCRGCDGSFGGDGGGECAEARAGSEAAAAAPAPGADAGGAAAAAHGGGARAGAKRAERPPPPPRPTHFLAVQTLSAQSADCIAAVQSTLRALDPGLGACCVDAAGAHVTLLVMNLEADGQLRAAGEQLGALGTRLRQAGLLVPLDLELRGLEHFRRQVLFLEVASGPGRDQLDAVAALAVEHFRAAGLKHEDGKPITPHITVAKTSRLLGHGGGGKRRRGGGRGGGVHQAKLPKIPWDELSEHHQADGGPVRAAQLQICAMQGRKNGGYYVVDHALCLDTGCVTSRDGSGGGGSGSRVRSGSGVVNSAGPGGGGISGGGGGRGAGAPEPPAAGVAMQREMAEEAAAFEGEGPAAVPKPAPPMRLGRKMSDEVRGWCGCALM